MIARYRRDVLGTSAIGLIYTGRERYGNHNRMPGLDSSFRFGDRYGCASRRWDRGPCIRTSSPPTTARRPARSTATRSKSPTTTPAKTGSATSAAATTRAAFAPTSASSPRSTFAGVYWESSGSGTATASAGTTSMRVGGDYGESYDQGGELLEKELEISVVGERPAAIVHAALPRTPHQGLRRTDIRSDLPEPLWRGTCHGEFLPLSRGTVGDEIDYAHARPAEGVTLSPGVRFDLGRHLRLTLDDRYQALDVESQRLFTAQILELRATYQFNLRTFVRLVSQYVDIRRNPELYSSEVDRRAGSSSFSWYFPTRSTHRRCFRRLLRHRLRDPLLRSHSGEPYAIL